MASKKKYDIETITFHEAVRRRPRMYIGDTAETGLRWMIVDLIDTFVDEIPSDENHVFDVTIHSDHAITISSNHLGLVSDVSSIEDVLTGKIMPDSRVPRYMWKSHAYVVLNCLSEQLQVRIERDGKTYEQQYREGIPLEPLHITGTSDQIKTQITFKPDSSIFTSPNIRYESLYKKLREKAFLNKMLTFQLIDARTQPHNVSEIHFSDGLSSAVRLLNDLFEAVHDEPISFSKTIDSEGFAIEFAFQYVRNITTNSLSYVNQCETYHGGTHLNGLFLGLTNALTQFVKSIDNEIKPLSVERIKSGLTAVIAVQLKRPDFDGATKAKLISKIKEQVAEFVTNSLLLYFQKNQDIAQLIWQHVQKNIPLSELYDGWDDEDDDD